VKLLIGIVLACWDALLCGIWGHRWVGVEGGAICARCLAEERSA
jgi:hypothetical protein